MANQSNPRPAPDNLQFDRAVHAQSPNATTDAGLTCSACGAALTTHYFHVAEQPTCNACKAAVEQANHRAEVQSRQPGVMLRAAAFGLGAAIVGAILYFAVIAITGWEIGLVAIVIGFMVGSAVRRGTRGVGGRRHQVLAVALTYFAVGLAYAPLAFKGFMEGQAAKTAAVSDSAKALQADDSASNRGAVDSATATQPQTGVDQADAQSGPGPTASLLLALGATFLFVFALPVIYVFGSMPSGLISGLIIVFGMQQAWRMTARAAVPISGPFRVGGTPQAPAA
jgi:hypothetical protein